MEKYKPKVKLVLYIIKYFVLYFIYSMQNTGIYILLDRVCLQMKHFNLNKSTQGHGGFLKTLQTG